MQLFTIGHSNHGPAEFLHLLQSNQIQCIVDIRSKPYSRWAPFANRENLQRLLVQAGIDYLYFGDVLGGLVPGVARLTRAERLQAYENVRQGKDFQDGICSLVEEIQRCRTCMLCAEEDPANCHRRLLVGPSITEKGIQIVHIRGDGRVEQDEYKGTPDDQGGQYSFKI